MEFTVVKIKNRVKREIRDKKGENRMVGDKRERTIEGEARRRKRDVY